MKNENELIRLFSINIRNRLKMLRLDLEKLQEIRMRVNGPMILKYAGREYFVEDGGGMSRVSSRPYIVVQNEMRETMEYIGNYSLYAFEDEIRQGFITVQGGHRIGIAGKVIVEDGHIKSIKYISSINIRISHEIRGCANKVLNYISSGDGMYHTLIISPPGCGKTTLLRDVVRQLSNGGPKRRGMTIGVVDERSEIASCYMGIPQNDVGSRTDVLDCCPKDRGMIMLIRSMSPEILAVDEIGGMEEVDALRYAVNCGCKMIATVHGSSMDDIRRRYAINNLVEGKVFERYIILDKSMGVGSVAAIYDMEGCSLF
ncbi:MAG: stage III sporulation protein AA [Lachnospiraceae bacterium]|nr:stage III sporulation protein AA [Lachnospiraceae bacterium]MDE6254172.1 stage III sporulation protein AA [Lachnospiraceae bacterium]